jgi:hypothetical protein
MLVIEPMLLKIAHEVPRGPGWAFEAKYDGYRAMRSTGGLSRPPSPSTAGRAFPHRALPARARIATYEVVGCASRAAACETDEPLPVASAPACVPASRIQAIMGQRTRREG